MGPKWNDLDNGKLYKLHFINGMYRRCGLLLDRSNVPPMQPKPSNRTTVVYGDTPHSGAFFKAQNTSETLLEGCSSMLLTVAG
jgi:hypothetical protein